MKLAQWSAPILAAAVLDAGAIHMSPNGIGQALIYPYYTVQSAEGSAFNSYISIVNHDGRGKALRVRFREGRNGREVLSFNLFLQYGDAWAGAVVPSAGGAAIKTVELSCTAPPFPIDFAPGSIPTREFSDAGYTGANGDGYGTDRARMREGYVEVLEMAYFGDITPDPATHCEDFRAERVAAAFDRPLGGISGTLTVINVANGMDFTVNADALQDVASQKYYRPANDPYPDFNAAEINRVSAFVQDGKLYRTTWASGLQAVEAVLMRSWLANEVVLDAGTASATDWIVTMPTRRFHLGPPPDGPFASALIDGRDLFLGLEFAPRDGTVTYYTEACGFLCPPQFLEADIRARWSTTALSFRNAGSFGPGVSAVLGSQNAWSIALPPATQNGSARVTFGGFSGIPETAFTAETTRIDNGSTGAELFRIQGVPVVGFMVRTFRNGTLSCAGTSCQGNYGGSFPHKSGRELQR